MSLSLVGLNELRVLHSLALLLRRYACAVTVQCFTGKGRCKHPHHPSAPPPPLRGSSMTARTSVRDPAHNSFATQNFFCSGREISQCDHVGLLLIFTHNQRKPHLFLCCYPESCADAVPAYIDLYPYSSRTHKTRYLQSIAQVLVANRNDQRPGRCLRGGFACGHEWEQAFDPEGKATGVDITCAPNCTHQAIITTSSTELGVKTIFILGVYLEDQSGIIADAAPKRQVK